MELEWSETTNRLLHVYKSQGARRRAGGSAALAVRAPHREHECSHTTAPQLAIDLQREVSRGCVLPIDWATHFASARCIAWLEAARTHLGKSTTALHDSGARCLRDDSTRLAFHARATLRTARIDHALKERMLQGSHGADALLRIVLQHRL